MTKDEKQLLLKDLCAMLPYWVFVNVTDSEDNRTNYNCLLGTLLSTDILKEVSSETSSLNYKPYLRPMESMTEEEKEELKNISTEYIEGWETAETSIDRWKLDAKCSAKRANFYCSHHLDWNGLIEKGLAIAVTEENNPY